MLAFLIRRILWLVPVMLTVIIVTFFLMYRAPGGPWDTDKPIPESARAMLNARFALDQPVWFNQPALQRAWNGGQRNPIALAGVFLNSQFFRYLGGLARFDLGPSYQSKGTVGVRDVLAERFPTSAKLGLVAIVFAVVVGLPLGVASAIRQ